jgi:hypothetical protein
MHDGHLSRSFVRASWLPAVALVPWVLIGCGADLYESRLDNTRVLFAHMELLNEHLLGKWTDPENAASLRVPLQFGLLAPPAPADKPAQPQGKPAEGAEGEGTDEEVHDDRQPAYLNLELPGLRGAFQARVKYIAPNNQETVGDAWLYVMTNHEFADRPEQAKEFNHEFIKDVAEAIQMAPPAAEAYESVRYPANAKGGQFVTPVRYTFVRIEPSEEIDGMLREFAVYMYEQGDVRAIVLFVLPQHVATSERFGERLPLCLETLEVSDRLNPASGGVGGTPSPSGF